MTDAFESRLECPGVAVVDGGISATGPTPAQVLILI